MIVRLIFCCILALSGPAAKASLIVSTTVGGIGGVNGAGNTFNSSIAHARSTTFDSGNFNTTSSATPLSQCGPQIVLGQLQAIACAEATSAGRLRASSGALTSANAFSSSSATITDTILAQTTPQFKIDLDFNYNTFGDAFWSLEFLIQIATGNPDNPFALLYSVTALSHPSTEPESLGARTIISRLDPNSPSGITTTYSSSLIQNFTDTYTLSIPLPLNQPQNYRFTLLTEASCDSDFCNSSINAFNTAYLGITTLFTSANGYTYPGAPANEPDANIPEPSTFWLLASSVILLRFRRR